MEEAYFLIKEALALHSAISPAYLQRKLKITSEESCKIIRKFLLEFNISLDVDLQKNCCKDAEHLQNSTCNLPRRNKQKGKREPMIVTIGGAKGGVGKSTLAINLVAMLATQGKRVLFVDADRIRSSSKFVERRVDKKIPTSWRTICLQNSLVSSEVLNLKPKFDEVIIDAGGGDTVSQRHALGISDILIMPFNPASPDLDTLEEMKNVVLLAKSFNPKLQVFALLNQADTRGSINEQGKKWIEQENYLRCLNQVLTRRVSIRNAWSTGFGIIELKPRDEKAVAELTKLYEEIYAAQTQT